MGITIGSAPDSWGVWFADDPLQTPASRFLDEVAEAGYEWIELGPYGYLPTDAAELSDELAKRDLKVSAGTIFAALHRPDHYDEAWAQVELVADLTRAVGGTHLVVIPGQWRSDKTGEALEPRELDEAGWQRLASGMDRLGADVKERYGLQMAFHSHADTHVDTQDQIERFLEMTDPEVVKLCLDTGHVSFSGGDNLEIIRRHPDRIAYAHLKQVDPQVVAKVKAEDLGFGDAVKLGAMVEPPQGVPDMPPVLAALEDLGRDIFAIVEQDLYPVAFDVPLPIARRTCSYLRSCRLPRA
ncbi:sugar phosphate isomerase/epimerase family protein [Kineococcus radiotolerans]|uniref:Xylose isomerase domain protein TIM barrel n=1 Tax=Kineococcus radiotolerans (strain ATCC BAA-149 / DSM 14245 / SRS30216) TaxID=266940 RepID=A6WFC9_KINRD|nr:sugar phosphate isomerase/epimerase [Kineococcus radiotolerans]ABS05518.1 Xylose isomerase domain protein TIM barrel [Kineococcus radiotolerans SRS30216 = ATCC BAA-149]